MTSSRREVPWLALVLLSLLVGLILNWERLGNPLVDSGREMNQPLRLLNGERLYADVQHYYGPFSPHFNAVLLKLFGVHLDVLRASGAGATLVIVVLVYWLARRLTGRAGAATAALAVTWLCAFQRDGNFIVPYSYSAIHGSALALGALACTVQCASRRRPGLLFLAGVCAGAALTAKTEMGVAAVIGGMAAACLPAPLRLGPLLRRALVFLLPALLLPAVVYGALAARVGSRALLEESFLLYRHLPAPVIAFSRSSLGLDHPWQALVRMGLVLLFLTAIAALIALAALALTRRRPDARGGRALLLRHGAWALVLPVLALTRATGIEIDPLAALPLILIAVLVEALVRVVRRWRQGRLPSPRTASLVVLTLFALASLARTPLSVRSGNSYVAFLLPAALVVFTFAWTWGLPAHLPSPSAARLARRLATAALLAWIATTAVSAQRHLHTRHIYPIVTPRGTLFTRPDRGQGFVEAIRFVEQRTRRGEPVAVLPEGTSILFFTDRRNPLKEEVATPGLLNEERAVRQLESSGTRLILITNRPTDEYGARAFGRDYHQRTMTWILDHFRLCGVFGPNPRPQREIGARQFFIKAYCRP